MPMSTISRRKHSKCFYFSVCLGLIVLLLIPGRYGVSYFNRENACGPREPWTAEDEAVKHASVEMGHLVKLSDDLSKAAFEEANGNAEDAWCALKRARNVKLIINTQSEALRNSEHQLFSRALSAEIMLRTYRIFGYDFAEVMARYSTKFVTVGYSFAKIISYPFDMGSPVTVSELASSFIGTEQGIRDVVGDQAK